MYPGPTPGRASAYFVPMPSAWNSNVGHCRLAMKANSESDSEFTTVAKRAHEIAARIAQLPYQIRAFVDQEEKIDLAQIRKELNPGRLEFDFFPVFVFIEQNWTPSHAQAFSGRVCQVTNGVESFIQAMQAGTNRGPKAWIDRREMAKFFVVARLTAAYVGDWAGQIAKRE